MEVSLSAGKSALYEKRKNAANTTEKSENK
jgi:hypothetical protein